jgi:hypothetical protein
VSSDSNVCSTKSNGSACSAMSISCENDTMGW